jgi:hypothetical protein
MNQDVESCSKIQFIMGMKLRLARHLFDGDGWRGVEV